MTRITFYSLAVITSLACLQPISLLAQAQDPNNPKDKKGDKGTQHAGKAAGPAGPVTHTQQTFHQTQGAPAGNANPQFHKSTNFSQAAQGNTGQPPTQNKFHKSNFSPVNTQAVTQAQAQPQAQAQVQGGTHHNHFNTGAQGFQATQTQGQFTPRGNHSNHYGGSWFAASVHPDWGNDGEHYYNHHHYRWYDGGWIIIDPGYGSGYSGNSIGAAVQQRLSEQGYYNGPIDGDVGPGTSQAIANYQGENGLRVTGHINHSLLDSLGLGD